MAAATASFSSSKETTNYARLCRLLVDVGSHVLRETFDKLHPPAGLHTALTRNHSTLQLLRTRRILNATQWGKLYPAIRTSVSSRDFDITLLTVLLRNICGLTPPATGWDALPPVTDTSVEADIARVKYFRNTVYGHAEQASVDDATFNAYWQDIQDALVRLGGADYGVAIDDLKNECMDPEIEDHYEELLRQWKKDEDNIKDLLEEMHRMLKELNSKTSASTPQAKDVEDPNDLIERICQLYITREGRISLFPWCEDFNFGLNDIFTRLKIVNRDKTRRETNEQNISMTEIFKPHKECPKPRTVLIEGEPGMGKTTYCQKLAYDWAKGQETHVSFPQIKLLLLLKCGEMTGSIWEAIDDQLLPKDIEEDTKENFFKFIRANQSQVLLVLDGLDEAPSNPRQMFSDLVESRELPKCHIVLTSRHEGGVKVSKYCDTLLEIVGFTEEDSRKFVQRYFKDMDELGQKLLREIECKKELKELTVNPLTTALLCLLCDDFKGRLPSSRTHLYLEISNCVLRRFRRKKELPDNIENLIEVYKEELEQLGLIALKGLEKDQMYFEKHEIGAGSTSEKPVLEFLSVQTRNSKRRPHLCYGFSHKSFQEFFAGFYLASQISKGEIDFESYVADEEVLCKLKQVILFAVGIIGLKGEDDALCLDVLKTIIKKANLAHNSILQSYYLCLALNCTGECSTLNPRLRAQMLHSIGTSLELKRLIISHNSCDVQSLGEALKANTTLTKLEMPSHSFGDLCAISLAGTLYVNKTLTEVDMSNNTITALGTQQLVNALMVNTTLLKLNLSLNFLHDDGARIFAEFLKAKRALPALSVSANGIGNPGVTALAEGLQMNGPLKLLDLSRNPSIGNHGVTSLCEALQINRTLTWLNLSGTGIHDVGIRSLSAVLKAPSSLTSLVLSDVRISAHSVKPIAEVLRVNSTLNSLDFQGNKVSVGGARLIAESLKFNTALKYLNLSRNNIRAKGAQFLSEALKVNSTLAILGLSQNALDARGAQFLSEGLRVNTALTQLDLSSNCMGDAGAHSVAEALKVNATVTWLSLSSNAIGDPGAHSLSGALQTNATLSDLDLSGNGIQSSGAQVFAEGRKTSQTSTLKFVNFSGNNIDDSGYRALVDAGFRFMSFPPIILKVESVHKATVTERNAKLVRK
ncbi:uncharacterized protein LOC144629303 [Oculina patagonica]